jgi:hypothetical protein
MGELMPCEYNIQFQGATPFDWSAKSEDCGGQSKVAALETLQIHNATIFDGPAVLTRPRTRTLAAFAAYTTILLAAESV